MGLIDISAFPLISQAVEIFAHKNEARQITILFPDEGAQNRYRIPASINGTVINVLHCAKKRDPQTGKLTQFVVPEADEFPSLDGRYCPVLIVDDVCDGGGTFVGIADHLEHHGLTLGLYVTHGIFSKGFSDLETRFNAIYTTDSFREWRSTGKLYVIPALPLLEKFRVVEANSCS